MFIIFEICLFIALGGLIYVFQNDYSVLPVVLKATASLFFVLSGLYGYIKNRENRRFTRLMLIALLFSMAGDVLLAIDENQGILFVLGVATFAIAHVFFSISFCSACRVRTKDIVATVIVFAGCVVLLCVGTFDFQGLLPVLLGYAAVVSFMMVKALSLYSCRKGRERAVWLIMVGGVLFLASDMVLLFWLFGIDMPKEVQSFNWVLYYLAQGCLSAAMNEKDLQFNLSVKTKQV